MGSATARRFALVAVIALLAPLWWQPVTGSVELAGTVVLRIAAPAPSPAPAIRRNVSTGPWVFGSRPLQGRLVVAALLMALVALVPVGPWTGVVAVGAGPSSLIRRRHAISLRAPPSA